MSASEPLRTASAAETEAAGARLAATLRPGDVVLLEGEMGAGKTTFVRGAARALGHAGRVTSPTFVLAHRYAGAEVAIAHLDLHRLSTLDDEDPGFLDDHLTPDAVAFVEWPDAAVPELGERRVRARVRLAHAGGDARTLEIEDHAP